MSDFSDLVVAIPTGISILVSTSVLVYRTWLAPKKASKQAAIEAATETAEKIFEALADGELDADELRDIQQSLRKEEDP